MLLTKEEILSIAKTGAKANIAKDIKTSKQYFKISGSLPKRFCDNLEKFKEQTKESGANIVGGDFPITWLGVNASKKSGVVIDFDKWFDWKYNDWDVKQIEARFAKYLNNPKYYKEGGGVGSKSGYVKNMNDAKKWVSERVKYDEVKKHKKDVWYFVIANKKAPQYPIVVATYFDDKNSNEKLRENIFIEAGFAAGGGVDSLEKELHKLQRDLNSSRLQTYIEGDNSEEQKARTKEREVKLTRFNEVLKLLKEKDGKFAIGGGVEEYPISKVKAYYYNENEKLLKNKIGIVLTGFDYSIEKKSEENQLLGKVDHYFIITPKKQEQAHDILSKLQDLVFLKELESVNISKYKFAAGGGVGEFDEKSFWEEARKKQLALDQAVKFALIKAVGIHEAIEFVKEDYSPVRPVRFIERAVEGNYVKLEEVNKRLMDSAIEEAEHLQQTYKDSGEGFGSSDFAHTLMSVLNNAGYKAAFVNNSLKRVDSNGKVVEIKNEYPMELMFGKVGGDGYATGGGVKSKYPDLDEKINVITHVYHYNKFGKEYSEEFIKKVKTFIGDWQFQSDASVGLAAMSVEDWEAIGKEDEKDYVTMIKEDVENIITLSGKSYSALKAISDKLYESEKIFDEEVAAEFEDLFVPIDVQKVITLPNGVEAEWLQDNDGKIWIWKKGYGDLASSYSWQNKSEQQLLDEAVKGFDKIVERQKVKGYKEGGSVGEWKPYDKKVYETILDAQEAAKELQVTQRHKNTKQKKTKKGVKIQKPQLQEFEAKKTPDGFQVFVRDVIEPVKSKKTKTEKVVKESEIYDLRLELGSGLSQKDGMANKIRDIFFENDGVLNKAKWDKTIAAVSKNMPAWKKAWASFKEDMEIETSKDSYTNPYSFKEGGKVSGEIIGLKLEGHFSNYLKSKQGQESLERLLDNIYTHAHTEASFEFDDDSILLHFDKGVSSISKQANIMKAKTILGRRYVVEQYAFKEGGEVGHRIALTLNDGNEYAIVEKVNNVGDAKIIWFMPLSKINKYKKGDLINLRVEGEDYMSDWKKFKNHSSFQRFATTEQKEDFYKLLDDSKFKKGGALLNDYDAKEQESIAIIILAKSNGELSPNDARGYADSYKWLKGEHGENYDVVAEEILKYVSEDKAERFKNPTLKRVVAAINDGKLKILKGGEKMYGKLKLSITQLVWARNFEDGFRIYVYEKGEHVGTVDLTTSTNNKPAIVEAFKKGGETLTIERARVMYEPLSVKGISAEDLPKLQRLRNDFLKKYNEILLLPAREQEGAFVKLADEHTRLVKLVLWNKPQHTISMNKKGGAVADDLWIQGAVQHKGILHRKAVRMGLIKEDQNLTERALKKIEVLSPTWNKRVELARTLKYLRLRKHEGGGGVGEKEEWFYVDNNEIGYLMNLPKSYDRIRYFKFSDAMTDLLDTLKSNWGKELCENFPKSKFTIGKTITDSTGEHLGKDKILFTISVKDVKALMESYKFKEGGGVYELKEKVRGYILNALKDYEGSDFYVPDTLLAFIGEIKLDNSKSAKEQILDALKDYEGSDFYVPDTLLAYIDTVGKLKEGGALGSFIGINWQSDFKEMDSIQDDVMEHVADMVAQGYKEGELVGEEQGYRGWWKVSVEEDENDEEIRNEEVAKNIRNGNTSGYTPTYSFSANVWSVKATGGTVPSATHGNYITFEPTASGLKIILTAEGKEKVEEDGLTEQNFDEFVDDIRGNSEYLYFMESPMGLTQAPVITDGWYYDDDGKFTDKGHSDSRVYWYPNYMISDFAEKLIKYGEVFFNKADEHAKGGGVKAEEFIATVKVMHKSIKEIVLTDGTRISGKDLMKNGGETAALLEKTYYLIVDLDERGEYAATVYNNNQDIIWEVNTEGVQELVQDGFLKYKPDEDLDGLSKYLSENGIIPKDTEVVSQEEYEKLVDKFENEFRDGGGVKAEIEENSRKMEELNKELLTVSFNQRFVRKNEIKEELEKLATRQRELISGGKSNKKFFGLFDDGGEVDAIDNPKALGYALKEYFKEKWNVVIETRYIKTVRGLEGSWYEISTFKSGHTIPNEVRRKALEIQSGEPIDKIAVSTPDDISYGTIKSKSIALYGRHWKTFLKNEIPVFPKIVVEENIPELEGGGRVEPRLYDFGYANDKVVSLYVEQHAPQSVSAAKDLLKRITSEFKEGSEYANFNPTYAVVYKFQYGWTSGWKVFYTTDKVRDKYFDEITDGKYKRRVIDLVNKTVSKADGGGVNATVLTKDGVEVEKASDKYKGHIFYDEKGVGYECLGYFPNIKDCMYRNLETGNEVVGCMEGFYYNNPVQEHAAGGDVGDEMDLSGWEMETWGMSFDIVKRDCDDLRKAHPEKDYVVIEAAKGFHVYKRTKQGVVNGVRVYREGGDVKTWALFENGIVHTRNLTEKEADEMLERHKRIFPNEEWYSMDISNMYAQGGELPKYKKGDTVYRKLNGVAEKGEIFEVLTSSVFGGGKRHDYMVSYENIKYGANRESENWLFPTKEEAEAGYSPKELWGEFAKGGVTTDKLNSFIAEINQEGGGEFSLGGAYGYYELWAKDKNGGSHRVDVGSKREIYEALIKNRYNKKYNPKYAEELKNGGNINTALTQGTPVRFNIGTGLIPKYINGQVANNWSDKITVICDAKKKMFTFKKPVSDFDMKVANVNTETEVKEKIYSAEFEQLLGHKPNYPYQYFNGRVYVKKLYYEYYLLTK